MDVFSSACAVVNGNSISDASFTSRGSSSVVMLVAILNKSVIRDHDILFKEKWLRDITFESNHLSGSDICLEGKWHWQEHVIVSLIPLIVNSQYIIVLFRFHYLYW
jgi:hypothetical protein